MPNLSVAIVAHSLDILLFALAHILSVQLTLGADKNQWRLSVLVYVVEDSVIVFLISSMMNRFSEDRFDGIDSLHTLHCSRFLVFFNHPLPDLFQSKTTNINNGLNFNIA